MGRPATTTPDNFLQVLQSESLFASGKEIEDAGEGAGDGGDDAEDYEGGEEAETQWYDGTGLDRSGLFFSRPAASLAGVVRLTFEGLGEGRAGTECSLGRPGEGGASWLGEEAGPGVDRVGAEVEVVLDLFEEVGEWAA